MKSVILGSTGQFGRDLASRLPGEIIPLTRSDIDLTSPDSLTKRHQLRPDAVFNCAAYNLVDKAESEPETAFAVNALGVRHLAKVCAELDCTLVHFSTDYVFGLDQQRNTPYSEPDAPGPVSVYGASKLTGEYFVRALCPKHFVVRTCGLYGQWGSGGKGRNFVTTMLRLASEGKPLRVVNDQVCTPTYTVDLASAAIALVQTGRYGLYHLTNSGSCTWFEFAQAIFAYTGVNANLTPITSDEYGAPAQRPGFSVLATSHDLPEAARLRPWQEALEAYLKGSGKMDL